MRFGIQAHRFSHKAPQGFQVAKSGNRIARLYLAPRRDNDEMQRHFLPNPMLLSAISRSFEIVFATALWLLHLSGPEAIVHESTKELVMPCWLAIKLNRSLS